MKININNGEIKYLYNENIDLDCIGVKTIKRASFVEPNNDKWFVDFTPIDINMKVDGFKTRSEALKYEIDYIENNIL
jgi:hypothetical protein